MPAVHYSATFSDGTRITRTTAPSSLKSYTHAWRLGPGLAPSFAGSEALARAASATAANQRRRYSPDAVIATEIVPVTIHPSRQAAKEGV